MKDEKNPLGLKKIHHVEFYVGNAKQAEFYYRKAFGFSRHAYSGLETQNRETTSYVLKQNRVNFLLTTPLTPEHPAAEHIKQHGDGVRDIAFLSKTRIWRFTKRLSAARRRLSNRTIGRTKTARFARRRFTHTATRSIRFSRITTITTQLFRRFLPGFVPQEVAAKMSGSFWLTTLSATSNSAR